MKERQQSILDFLEDKGTCSYQELEKLLGVSNMTVRRDVERLAATGAVIKTLGGIQKANAPASFYESSLLSRLSSHRDEKRLIAQMAVDSVKPHQSIYLDGSSTCLEMAKLLARQSTGLTIITNSALALMELTQGSGNTIICMGGQHDPVSFCLIGPKSEEEARKYFVDQAFVSTKGVLADEGTFESSIATFRVKQIMAKQCTELILLADSSKFGQRALCKVLDISQINMVITDEGISQTDEALLRDRVESLCIAHMRTRYG